MYLMDYHTHTKISSDSTAALEDMARAAADAGLSQLCVTDHCDLLDVEGKPNDSFRWAPALAQFAHAAPRFLSRGLELKLGLELGVPHIDPAAAARLLELPELDFVLGSVHNLTPAKGGIDFYFVEYPDEAACLAALEDYFSSLAVLAATDLYDVLAHIIYPLRYMKRPLSLLDRYQDAMRAILRTAAEKGRGMEVNTYRGRTLEDWRPILAMFRACGGEIVTVGSDAHVPTGVGKGIPEAYELIREAGFSYVAGYHRRKPVFHKI